MLIKLNLKIDLLIFKNLLTNCINLLKSEELSNIQKKFKKKNLLNNYNINE